jgi:hypothetical protein
MMLEQAAWFGRLTAPTVRMTMSVMAPSGLVVPMDERIVFRTPATLATHLTARV